MDPLIVDFINYAESLKKVLDEVRACKMLQKADRHSH